MVKAIVKCVCGEIFRPEIDLDRISSEIAKTGIVPLLVSHKDHFVTIYIDKNGTVRGVERVILVEEDSSPLLLAEDIDMDAIRKAVLETEKMANPDKDYSRYVSLLQYEIKSNEALFAAGEIMGHRMWMRWREPILKMGAKYVPQINLIIKSELKPILDKTGTATLAADNEVHIANCIAPQFVVGLAQGVLNAVSEAAKGNISVKIEYNINGNSVTLSVL